MNSKVYLLIILVWFSMASSWWWFKLIRDLFNEMYDLKCYVTFALLQIIFADKLSIITFLTWLLMNTQVNFRLILHFIQIVVNLLDILYIDKESDLITPCFSSRYCYLCSVFSNFLLFTHVISVNLHYANTEISIIVHTYVNNIMFMISFLYC